MQIFYATCIFSCQVPVEQPWTLVYEVHTGSVSSHFRSIPEVASPPLSAMQGTPLEHDEAEQYSQTCRYGSALQWRNIMMTSSNGNILRATGPLCGEFTVPVNSPHKGQWHWALVFSLICVWINGWVNNREAGELRWHRGHYDVNVMWLSWRFKSPVTRLCVQQLVGQ